MKLALAPILSNREVMPGVYLMWLESPYLTAQPGQFVMVRCGEGMVLRRPLSIHQLDGKKLALLFSVVGKGTYWLSQRQTGETIDLVGPLGSGYSIPSSPQRLLLVAGGIGIAPLRFLADEALNRRHSVRLLIGAPSAEQLYPWKKLPKGTDRFLFTEDGTLGEYGVVTSQLHIHSDWADQVFACGPIALYRDMALKKQELSLEGKPVQISLEARMGCGLGVCYGCTVKTKSGLKQVCQDGPVFELDDILWDELSVGE